MGSAAALCELNLAQSIADQAHFFPKKTAIEENGLMISYRKLHTSAQNLARTLQCNGLVHEDAVLVLAKPGATHIMCQLAVAYVGGTNVPLDMNLSDEDIQMRASAVKARFLIVGENCKDRSIGMDVKIEVNSDWRHQTEMIHSSNGSHSSSFPVQVERDHRSSIFFSSGTTGVPKAIEILGRNIIALSQDPFCYGNAMGGRFGYLGYVGFDSSILDTWIPLIHGATIVILEKRDTLSPETMSKSLRERMVTYLFMPALLFNLMAPTIPCSFSHMEFLMVGGEPPSIPALKAVLQADPPKHLLNLYGPSECTGFQVYHECTLFNLPETRPPIGKPILNVQTYVLDESFSPVAPGTYGELFIGGATVSRGYLFAPEKTAASYPIVMLPGHRDGVRLYRTGDIVFEDTSGNLTWVGRKDRQVKFRGYRVRLDVIEAELVLTGSVMESAALLIQLPGQQAKSLVGCVVLKDPSMDSMSVLQRLKNRIPEYMIPHIVTFDKFPRNTNGKVDRKKLSEELVQHMKRKYKAIEDLASDEPNSTSTEVALKRMWMHILGLPSTDIISHDADFFSLGANSLAVASLIASIRQICNVSIIAQVIFEHPTIQELATFIDRGQDLEQPDFQALRKQLLADTELGKDLLCPGKGEDPVDWLADGEGRVFFTGVTGFVGAFFVIELLKNANVKSVKCLVRANSLKDGLNRVLSNFRKYNLDASVSGDQLSKLEIVAGDLAKLRFGMDEESFQDLANWSSVIFHFAAQVNYNQPYSSHRPANILGTLNILRLATAGNRRLPFHYTSSVAAFGPTGFLNQNEVGEDEPLEPLIDKTIPYENGYGQSQWVVEVILTRLIRRGFPIAVYRLGFVLCSNDGVGNPSDFVSRLVSDSLKMGSYPYLPDQRRELIPVDYVASALFHISASSQSLGHAYHIVPEASWSIDHNDFFDLVAKLGGRELRMLPYQEWLMELRRMIETSRSEEGGGSMCEALMPLLQEEVYGEKTRLEVYEGMARYRIDNTLAALAGFQSVSVDGHLPSLNKASLEKYLTFIGAVTRNRNGE